MIQAIGHRLPRLYFVDEDGEAYYFKEELILPEGYLEKPEEEGEEIEVTEQQYRDTVLYCARMSVKIAPLRPLSARIVSTYRLAKMLATDDFVAEAKFASLLVEDERIRGTRIPPVGGAIFTELQMLRNLKGYRVSYSTEALRQLTVLPVFDFLCGQVDRHSKNIKLFTDANVNELSPLKEDEEGQIIITGVCAIDHDLSFGELSYEEIRQRICAGLCISPEIYGEMQYPAVDAPFLDRVFSHSEDQYRDLFFHILSNEEIEAFLDRLRGLQRVVKEEREREEKRVASGENFVSRFLTTDRDYEMYLSHMIKNAKSEKPDANLRFSTRPTYLKPEFLRGDPLPGGAPEDVMPWRDFKPDMTGA